MKITNITKGKSGIYCLQNTVNNKRYVGSSLNIYNRLLTHRSYLRGNTHSNPHLQNSFNKYGGKNFVVSVLEFCESDLLAEREQYYIDLLLTEYNIVRDVIRCIPTIESRVKQSKTRIKMFESGELQPGGSKSKPVNVYNLRGELKYSFESVSEAARTLKMSKSSIKRNLNGTAKQARGYIFSEGSLKIDEFIFAIKGNTLMTLEEENKIVYFRSQARCAKYLNVGTSSIEKFLSETKNSLFKNRFKLGLIKSCELLEHLEADNQQPSDIEIY